jgi:hypothetical protein
VKRGRRKHSKRQSRRDRRRCQHRGCGENSQLVACYLPDDDPNGRPTELLCPDHAAEHGYCCVCGQFWSGIESFDFEHPGLCDNCFDSIYADSGDGDGDGFNGDYYEPPDFDDEDDPLLVVRDLRK